MQNVMPPRRDEFNPKNPLPGITVPPPSLPGMANEDPLMNITIMHETDTEWCQRELAEASTFTVRRLRSKRGRRLLMTQYDLYLHREYELPKLMMTAQLSSTGVFCIRQNSDRLGVLHRNIAGASFLLRGPEPPVGREMGRFYYGQNVIGPANPRRMKVALPHGEAAHLMVSKTPARTADGGYVLAFRSREAVLHSVKNMQLVRFDDHAATNLIAEFCKIGDDEYELWLNPPFSPVQGFGMALSALARKMCCEGW